MEFYLYIITFFYTFMLIILQSDFFIFRYKGFFQIYNFLTILSTFFQNGKIVKFINNRLQRLQLDMFFILVLHCTTLTSTNLVQANTGRQQLIIYFKY